MTRLPRVVLAATLAFVPFAAHSATVQNSVFQNTTCGLPASPIDVERTNITIDTDLLVYTGENCTIAMKSYAGGGVVGILGTGGQIAGLGRPIIESDFDANSVARDIQITVKDGYAEAELLATYGPTIDVVLNASLFAAGSATGPLVAGSPSSRSARAALRAVVEISGTRERIPVRDQTEINLESGYSNISETTGPFTFGDPVRASITASWQSPLAVIFRLQGSMDLLGYTDTAVSADVDAINSLSFSQTGPAFLLPEGFTVNAPELNIFDNRWVDPRITPPNPSAVPLPAGMPLLLAGLGALAFVRRRNP